jgi:exopolyphosphatase/guanosine-5'-triphosphate,3'-diphosphate pyrophosphatase
MEREMEGEAGMRETRDGLLERFEREPDHVFHVCRLALELFDALEPLHGLGARERKILEEASTLHDIGWAVSGPDGRGHHKESARLIREADWPGVGREVVEEIALVARYHRKSLPSAEAHEEFAKLDEASARRVRWLSALLRVADGMDRRHVQAVERMTVELRGGGDGVRIRVLGRDGLEAEIRGGLKKVDLLAEMSGGVVEIVRGDDSAQSEGTCSSC